MFSLFRFSLGDLSSGDIGVLKSPRIIVLVSLIPEIEKDLFDVHGCTIVWGINIYDHYVFLIYGSLKQYEMAFFIPSDQLWLEVHFIWYKDGNPRFLLSLCMW